METKFIKFISIIFIIIIFPIIGLSQAVISVDKMNVFYQDVENPISVAIAGINSEKVKIEAIGATLKKIDNIHYFVTPINEVKVVTINVFVEDSNKTINYGSFIYRVKAIPTPSLMIAGKRVNENNTVSIKLAQLLSSPYLMAYLDNFIFEINFIVEEFNISFELDGKTINQKIKGNRIPKGILGDLKKLDKNSKIIISNIKVKYNNSFKNAYSFRIIII